MNWIVPPDLDPECVALCVALNGLPGVETFESCCGHGERPLRVWFRITDWSAEGLAVIARVTCPRYFDSPFVVMLDHGDLPEYSAYFLLEGPPGCFVAANALAKAITETYADPNPNFPWRRSTILSTNVHRGAVT